MALLYPRLFIGIFFTPHGIGDHLANVYRNGKHIPNSPFKFSISESDIGTAIKVKASGRGLNEGMANELSEFVVNVKDAGCGGLSVTIEGSSDTDVEYLDNHDGSYLFIYKPTEPGNYIINVKLIDVHVPGWVISMD